MHKSGLYIMGGSTYYTLLLFDSLATKGVAGHFTRITLFGRNQPRLRLLAKLGNQRLAGLCKIDVSLDINDCLNDEYGLIFNQIRFGGMQSRDRDEKTALSLNMPADETIGIVGVSNAIRAVHGIRPYLEVIQQKQSEYVLVNFTNPCSILTQYMIEHFAIPAIGICDYPQMMKEKISQAMGIAVNEIEMNYFGVNHFALVYSVSHQGRQLLPDLLKQHLSFKPRCNQYFTTLLNVSWRFVFERQSLLEEQQNHTNRASQLLDIEAQMDGLLERGCTHPEPYMNMLQKRQCDWFNLVVSPLFSNLLGQSEHRLYINGPSYSQESKETWVMEGLCKAGTRELEPANLPESLVNSPEFYLIQLVKLAERELLKGILEHNGNRIIKACLANPMINNLGQIQSYFSTLSAHDELIHHYFNSTQD